MNKEFLLGEICNAIQKVRTENPLVPSITNAVTMDFVANAQLALGARAAVVYYADEAECLSKSVKSFYVNMGTMHPVFEKNIPEACRIFHEKNLNWVLDPVACGLGNLRTKLLFEIKDYKPQIVRGNASEIISLASLWNFTDESAEKTSGVDSSCDTICAKKSAECIARFTGGSVSVSGKIDFVTDGSVSVFLAGGSPLMTRVTGFGCSLGGVMASFASVSSPLVASLAGSAVYKAAGKIAMEKSLGPSSFKSNFLDILYSFDGDELLASDIELSHL